MNNLFKKNYRKQVKKNGNNCPHYNIYGCCDLTEKKEKGAYVLRCTIEGEEKKCKTRKKELKNASPK